MLRVTASPSALSPVDSEVDLSVFLRVSCWKSYKAILCSLQEYCICILLLWVDVKVGFLSNVCWGPMHEFFFANNTLGSIKTFKQTVTPFVPRASRLKRV